MRLAPASALIVGFALLLLNGGVVAEAFILLGVVTSIPFLLLDSNSLFGVVCTMLPMEPAPTGAGQRHIRIMHDGNEAEIFGEIKDRWRLRMRRLHGEINFSNAAERETAKFAWLKDNGVITEEECEEALRKIRANALRGHTLPEQETCN